jgi:hypothetical protein
VSRLEVPLVAEVLWHTQETALRAFLDLELRDSSGNWHVEPFRVDTGADVTQLAAATAKALGLPMPQQGMLVPVTTAAGPAVVTLRSGLLRFRIPGMDPVEHVVPCHFLGDPDAPALTEAVPATLPRSLLALAGVAEKLRFTFDGTPSPPNEPVGKMVVERI